MTSRVYFRPNGAAATTFVDTTDRIPFFDKEQPIIQMGMSCANGAASQGTLVVPFHRSTDTLGLSPHGLVRWTEDAPGCEYWLAQGRMSSTDVGRGVQVSDDNLEVVTTVDDCNMDMRGLSFTEDWVRPEETDTDRLYALQAYTLNGVSSTRPNADGSITYRPSTIVVVADSHLCPDTNTVTMPAKTYPAGTEPAEVVDDCSSTAGKIYGVVIHHGPAPGDSGVIAHWTFDDPTLSGAGPEYTATDVETGTIGFGSSVVYGHYGPADTAFGCDGSPPNGYGWARTGHTGEVPGVIPGSDYTVEMDILWEEDPSIRSPGWQWTDGAANAIGSIVPLAPASYSTDTLYHLSQTLTAPAGAAAGWITWSSAAFTYVDNLSVTGPSAEDGPDTCSHLCLEYIVENDHDTYQSTVKISDQIADWDPYDLLAPVCEPIWDQGKGRQVNGQSFVSGIVSRYGSGNQFLNVLSATAGDIYEYWNATFNDSESVNATQAEARAGVIRAYRSVYDETNLVSIILSPEQTYLITAGMSLQIKAMVVADTTTDSDDFLWRRIVQLQWEPRADGMYRAIMHLNRGIRRQPASSGKPLAAAALDAGGTDYDPTGSGLPGTPTTVQGAIDEISNLLDGGLTDQVLTKVSNTDYDVAWEAPAAGTTFGTPAIVLGTAAAAGSTDEAIRRDSTIVAFDATAPVTQAFSDSAATGSATVAARRDHKHGMPADAGAGGGVSWSQNVNESGTSFANWTASVGSWDSDGTVIRHTSVTGAWQWANFTTLLPLGYPLIAEAECRFPTTGQGTGSFVESGIKIGSIGVIFRYSGTQAIIHQDFAVSDQRDVNFTIALDTWYKLRCVVTGSTVTTYVDGVLKATTRLTGNVNADYFGLGGFNSIMHYRNIKLWSLSGGAPA